MTANIYPDVSKWQVAVDDRYPRRFLMFRALDEYGSRDANAVTNLDWCINNRRAGKLVNFGVYIIPGFASNENLLAGLADLNLPTDCVIMVDWESWGGKLPGNHSTQNNDLTGKLLARQGRRGDLVWGYGNRNDLKIGWPTRPPWLGLIVAGYSSDNPQDEFRNVVGWQYTNGTENHTTWPTSTAPFGRCDHNALFIDYPTVTPEDDLTPEEHDALMKIADAVKLDTTHPGVPSLGDVWRLAQADTTDAIHPWTNASISDAVADLSQAVATLAAQLDAVKAAVTALSTGAAVAYKVDGTLTPMTP